MTCDVKTVGYSLVHVLLILANLKKHTESYILKCNVVSFVAGDINQAVNVGTVCIHRTIHETKGITVHT